MIYSFIHYYFHSFVVFADMLSPCAACIYGTIFFSSSPDRQMVCKVHLIIRLAHSDISLEFEMYFIKLREFSISIWSMIIQRSCPIHAQTKSFMNRYFSGEQYATLLMNCFSQMPSFKTIIIILLFIRRRAYIRRQKKADTHSALYTHYMSNNNNNIMKLNK